MFKKTSSGTPNRAKYKRQKLTRRQKITHLCLIAVLILVIAAIWATRLPRYYVNLFINHYDGSSAVLSEMDGLTRSEAESAALLPLQLEFDDWKQTHLRTEATVTAQDGAVLRGGLYDAGSDVTVILLHSFDQDSRSADYLFAPYYAAKGFNLLLPDSRDHGESEGDCVTYGLLEGQDLVCWMKWLQAQYGSDHKIILHGDTLGANAALAGAAAASSDPAVADSLCFAVAESPVINLYSGGQYLLHSQFNFPGLLVSLCDLTASKSLGCSMKEIDLNTLAANCAVPVLILQGTGDAIVDPDAVQSYCDSHPDQIAEVISADCGHGMVYATVPDTCRTAVDDLIRQTLS